MLGLLNLRYFVIMWLTLLFTCSLCQAWACPHAAFSLLSPNRFRGQCNTRTASFSSSSFLIAALNTKPNVFEVAKITALDAASSIPTASLEDTRLAPGKDKFLLRLYTSVVARLLTHAGIVVLFQKYKTDVLMRLSESSTMIMVGLTIAALVLDYVVAEEGEEESGDKLAHYWIPSFSAILKGSALGMFSLVMSKNELWFTAVCALAVATPSHLVALKNHAFLPDTKTCQVLTFGVVGSCLGYLGWILWPLRFLPVPTLLLKLGYVAASGGMVYGYANNVLSQVRRGSELLTKRQYTTATNKFTDTIMLAFIVLMDLACTLVL